MRRAKIGRKVGLLKSNKNYAKTTKKKTKGKKKS